MANAKTCSVARSKELDILCLHDVGHTQFCIVMYNITVVIVAVVVPSLYFRCVERV